MSVTIIRILKFFFVCLSIVCSILFFLRVVIKFVNGVVDSLSGIIMSICTVPLVLSYCRIDMMGGIVLFWSSAVFSTRSLDVVIWSDG